MLVLKDIIVLYANIFDGIMVNDIDIFICENSHCLNNMFIYFFKKIYIDNKQNHFVHKEYNGRNSQYSYCSVVFVSPCLPCDVF